nr:RNA-directed DNA polymerase, eukaryota, reverse transcriptase zinc-binding domain protein [Tanacetum cinerariifolium]
MNNKDADVARILANGDHGLHYLGLQETMPRNIDRISLQAVWGNNNFEFALKNSEGKSGGIISIWDPSKFTLQESVDGDGFLAKKLWHDLRKLYMDFDSLTIIMGDFDEVRADTERLGTTLCLQGAINFNDFISSSGLFDLPSYSFTLALVREYSGHVPILVSNKNVDFGPVPFKLCNSWLAHDEFQPIVLNSWASPPSKPFRKFALSFKEKLQGLKLSLKVWRKQVSASENSHASAIRSLLLEFDTKAEAGTLTPFDIDQRLKYIKDLHDLEYKNIKDLCQKAKFKWALEGDENSSFFHGIINSRRNRSRINENTSRPSFTSGLFKTLTFEDSCSFDLPMAVQEIKDAVWDCGGDKAPGLDGFSFKFIKAHWDIFIGCQYKIIAKILANRLGKVIVMVVSDVQMAFIKGHQIMDGPLLVNEIIAWAKMYKKKLFLLKVEFEKSFDTLSWSFLESVICQMGFSFKWRSWILACLRSGYTSTLINGSPTPEFKLERGLRLGDPLSPLLFILAVEALDVALLEARAKNLFRGVEVGIDKINISHLQYADDALIMVLVSVALKFAIKHYCLKGGGGSLRKRIPFGQNQYVPYMVHLEVFMIRPLLDQSQIGNGESTKFWLDKWLGGSSLSESYPRLFRIDLNQHCLVRDRAPTAINIPSDASVTVVVAPVSTPVIDPITVTITALLQPEKPLTPASLPATRWNRFIPIKINISTWRVLNERLPTRYNLDMRGIDLHTVRCPICDDGIETEFHLFGQCKVAIDTWIDIFKWWNLNNRPLSYISDMVNLADHSNLSAHYTPLLDVVV